MLARPSGKVQLYIFWHSYIVEIDPGVSVAANQHRVQAIVLQAVEGRVKRILPDGNVAIYSTIKHSEGGVEIGCEEHLIIFHFQIVYGLIFRIKLQLLATV